MPTTATKTDNKLILDIWNAFNFQIVFGPTLLNTLGDETRLTQENKLVSRTTISDYLSFIHPNSQSEA